MTTREQVAWALFAVAVAGLVALETFLLSQLVEGTRELHYRLADLECEVRALDPPAEAGVRSHPQ